MEGLDRFIMVVGSNNSERRRRAWIRKLLLLPY
jgi:hypothetical protein